MKIIRTGDTAGPRVIVLGTFDGMHLGHRELIRQGKLLAEEQGAELRVCTFDRHPLEILMPDRAPGRLQTEKEQAETAARLGADELRVIAFTRDMAETEPEDFIRGLTRECDLKAAVVGWNYSFGRRGRGNPALLREMGAQMGFQTIVVPPVRTEAGEIISSSAIRERLNRGDAAGAWEMLGEPYEISGTVVNGKHQGSRIGFPTANIQPAERKLLPAHGVYICRMESGADQWNAVVNIGLQPTIPSGRVTVEAHALGAEVELYGREARVRLLRFLRGEKKFASVEELKAQINQDKEAAKVYFSRLSSGIRQKMHLENLPEARK